MTHLEIMLLGNVVLASIFYLAITMIKCANESTRKSAIQWFIIEATFFIVMVALPFLANMFNDAHGFGQDRVYVFVFMGTASIFVLVYRILIPIIEMQTKERQPQEEVTTSQDVVIETGAEIDER